MISCVRPGVREVRASFPWWGWVLISLDLPEFYEDHMDDWFGSFQGFIATDFSCPAIAAAIEIIAVAMVGAIRFRGPITTRTTPASPTAPYSAVVDLDRGRE